MSGIYQISLVEELNFEFNEGDRRLKNRKTGIVEVVYFSTLNDLRRSLCTNEWWRPAKRPERCEQYRQADFRRGVDGFVIIHPAVRRRIRIRTRGKAEEVMLKYTIGG